MQVIAYVGYSRHVLAVALLVCCAALVTAQQTPTTGTPLAITTDSLPDARPHQEYSIHLESRGGTPPLRWAIVSGELPKGLTLDEETGVISGTPEERGDFEVSISLSDSAQPPHTTSKDFRLSSTAALSIEWRVYPRVDSDQISGSVVVSNGTKDAFDLTVIVVAVNEIGKAFALGYQRFDLRPQTKEMEIKFGSTMPRGQYVIHADAIADVPDKNAIYRDRLQTPQALVVTAPE
jgi:hypothetical protein